MKTDTTIADLVTEAFKDIGVATRAIYPVPEAKQILGGIGTTTIYELMKTGEIERVNIGRRAFVTATSLVAYVDRLSEAAGKA
jgi:Helix-turn-helix domain